MMSFREYSAYRKEGEKVLSEETKSRIRVGNNRKCQQLAEYNKQKKRNRNLINEIKGRR